MDDSSPLPKKLLLVDYENVQKVDLDLLGDDFEVLIFVGVLQKNVPMQLVSQAQEFGERCHWLQVTGQGPNALDFFIAYHLGRVRETNPSAHCVVLSKDKGFDPLLAHLNASGLSCERVASLDGVEEQVEQEAAQSKGGGAPSDSLYTQLIEKLSRAQPDLWPSTRTALFNFLRYTFNNKTTEAHFNRISEAEFNEAFKRLKENNQIVTNGTKIAYRF